MAEAVEIPSWLKNLPLAPEYRPTETEFADPIAFISSIEREASAFGICKVIPPLPRPSKKYVLANLKRSLAAHPDHPSASSASADPPIFTTRHQELGVRRGRALPVQKQVWQSGEFYTLDQFEAKAKAFSRTQLGGFKEVNPLLIETLFWKSAAEKPVYVEYANDVPGSGFGVPEEPFRYCLKRRRKQKRGVDKASVELPNRPLPKKSDEHEAVSASGWKLSNCPWNLQVIARSPGSLTRFMPDEVPGVTSPMVYIGMLFSWFAWHVEDHELHSLNFLHMGSPKTWYAVPGEHASTLEEIVRVQGYGGNVDRLGAFIMLGEKTTLLSPEVLLASRVPCCRLVQHPGEFVVTFPRAYHVGFSHGFNCGEAANFATPKWLMVAKQAAIRRAAMNFLPMLSHQQLLYLLSISFITSVPREQLPGARSSRLRDRKKEEREILVKKAFLDDIMNENNLLLKLLSKATIMGAVLWEPELLPSTSLAPQTHASFATTDDLIKAQCEPKRKDSLDHKGEASCTQDPHKSNDYLRRKSPDCTVSAEAYEDARADCINEQAQEDRDADEIDLPFGLNVDSGSLACVACGILGYPFMAILQPSERASKKLFALNIEESNTRPDKLQNSCVVRQIPCSVKSFGSEENYIDVNDQRNEDSSANSLPENIINMSLVENLSPSGQCSSHAIGDLIDKKVDISRSSDLTEAERLSSVCLSTVTNLSNEKQLLNTMDNQVCELSSQEQDDPCVQVERSCSSCSYEIKYDNLRGQHSYNETKEPPQHASMKNNAEVKCKLCLTEFPGTISANETNKLRVPESRSSDEISNWNRSSGFLRPRIFCLQHALVAEDLLQCNGGARMLIICHSDYLKIKALAISIAEEINVQFDCGDISLVGASSSDLDLINISIDEEGHEENGDDWTSKLGLNLKYCAKLKKETPSNQEHLALSMGEIFSDPTVSAVSNIKWLSRKSRTPYKVVGVVQSRSQFYAKAVKSEPVDKNTDSITDSAKVRKVHRNCMSSRHPGLPMSSTFKESCSGNKTAMVVAGDGRCKYGLTSKDCNQRVADIIENLHTVPIEIAEYPQKHLIDWVTLEVRTYSEVVSSRSSHHLPASEKSDAGYSEGSPDIHSNRLSWREAVCGSTKSACNLPCQISEMSEEYEEAYGSNNKISRCDGPDIPVGASILESENFEDLQLVLDKSNLDEFVGNKGPACESGRRPLLEKLDNIEIQLQNKLAVEESSGDDMFADPAAAKLEGMFENSILRGYKMQQKFSEGTEHIDDDINVFKCGNQILAVNNSEILQEIPCTDQMEGNALSDHCVKADTQTLDCSLKLTETVFISVTEISAMQEAVENAIDLCVSTESSFSPVNDKDDFIKADVQTASNSVMELVPESCGISMVESSTSLEAVGNRSEHSISIDISSSLNDLEARNFYPRVDLIPYVRRGKKRKNLLEQAATCEDGSVCFVRSPCEGLRPRTQIKYNVEVDIFAPEKKCTRLERRLGNSDKIEDKCKSFKCDIEGCFMSFVTKGDLARHKRNRCTIGGCGKTFSSHKYAIRHQCVHQDDRPLKCPWQGCNMTFKWTWARTEHVRVHTGERPYKCSSPGCGQTFRFVSDFSRHRRKTGHYAATSAG